jgi:hypothetical protein
MDNFTLSKDYLPESAFEKTSTAILFLTYLLFPLDVKVIKVKLPL